MLPDTLVNMMKTTSSELALDMEQGADRPLQGRQDSVHQPSQVSPRMLCIKGAETG